MGVEHLSMYIMRDLRIDADSIPSEGNALFCLETNPIAYYHMGCILENSRVTQIETDDPNDKEFLFAGSRSCFDDVFKTAMNKVMNDLVNLINQVNPQVLAFFSDGVPPQQKIWQQKERRFYPTRIYIDGELVYSSALICPGTEFAEMFRERLRNMVTLLNQEPSVFVFSDDLVPGEGEHKLIHFVRHFEQEGKIIIYGNDSDLLVLATLINRGSIYVLKKNEFKPRVEPGQIAKTVVEYKYLSIDNLKKKINAQMKCRNIMDGCIDFMMIIMFLGNDFLPKLHCFDNFKLSITKLFEVYDPDKLLHTEEEKGGKTVYNIHQGNFNSFVRRLARDEEKSVMSCNPGSWFLQKNMKYNEGSKNLDTEGFINDYYFHVAKFYGVKKKRIPDMVMDMSREYLGTMEWVFNYYMGHRTDDSIFYKYSHPPLLNSLGMVKFAPAMTVHVKKIDYYETMSLTPMHHPSFLKAIILQPVDLALADDPISNMYRKKTFFRYLYHDAPLLDEKFPNRRKEPCCVIIKRNLEPVSREFLYFVKFYAMDDKIERDRNSESHMTIIDYGTGKDLTYAEITKTKTKAPRQQSVYFSGTLTL